MFYDSTYMLVLIGALICSLASMNVNNTFKRFSKVANKRGLTAQDVAKKVLSAAALTYVASLFSSILQMIRLILMTRGRDNRR